MSATMTKPTRPATPPAKLLPRVDDRPDVAKLIGRLADLRLERTRFAADVPSAATGSTSPAAEAMAAGQIETGRELSKESASREFIAREGVRDTDKAIAIVEADLAAAREKGRAEVCRDAMPAHKAALRRVIAALQEFNAARDELAGVVGACRTATGMEIISPLGEYDAPTETIRFINAAVVTWVPLVQSYADR